MACSTANRRFFVDFLTSSGVALSGLSSMLKVGRVGFIFVSGVLAMEVGEEAES